MDSTRTNAKPHQSFASSGQELSRPGPDVDIHKDECAYCFWTPHFPNGLYVCLRTFIGVCARHLKIHHAKTKSEIFLNIWYDKPEIDMDRRPPESDVEEPRDKVPRKNDEESFLLAAVVVYPEMDIRIPLSDSPVLVHDISDRILQDVCADVKRQMEKGVNWEGSPLLETTYVEDLLQLDVVKMEPPGGWHCEEPGCEFRSNLWFNLTDGAVMCGRGQVMLDGNGHAIKHAKNTGFRLVVRLGTISKGVGEVYLYDFENDKNEGFVNNPYLADHLSHFGIDVDKLEKTEKNFTELEKSMDLKHDWDVIQEKNLNLEPKYGAGFTGLINLGSSCYMNSVLQTLLNIPDFVQIYDENVAEIFNSVEPPQFYDNFNWQLGKVLHSMNATNDFSKSDPDWRNGILPKRFKDLSGGDHPEFSTPKQQDVEHYIRYLMELVDRHITGLSSPSPVNAVRFKLFERFEDIASGQVRYNSHDDVILPLVIDNEFGEEAYSHETECGMTMSQCITRTFDDDIIDDYVSPITKEKRGAKQTIRFGSFPDYLFVQLKRFTYTMTGEQKKLHVKLEEMDNINLEAFKTTGLQPDEVELPSEKEPQNDAAKNETIKQLSEMGFTENAIRRGMYFTNGTEVSAVSEWLLSNMGEPDFNDPLPEAVEPSTSSAQNKEKNGQNAEVASDLMEDPSREVITAKDGQGIYELCGFISHIGKTPNSGHYVVHLKKDGVWYIYNDEKVCISQSPPKALGYVYLYKRSA